MFNSKFYGCIDLGVIFNNSSNIKSFFPYKDGLAGSLTSKDIYKASCWDCNELYIGKTKRWLHDRKSELFNALLSNTITSALADQAISTGHNLKWDHFEILATGRSDHHGTIKETLQPSIK